MNVPKNSKLLGALENWYLSGMGKNEQDVLVFESRHYRQVQY
jgi:hypothetical protein